MHILFSLSVRGALFMFFSSPLSSLCSFCLSIELALITNKPRAASVHALGEVTCAGWFAVGVVMNGMEWDYGIWRKINNFFVSNNTKDGLVVVNTLYPHPE